MSKKSPKKIVNPNGVEDLVNEVNKRVEDNLKTALVHSFQSLVEDSLQKITLLPVIEGKINIADEPEAVLRIETVDQLIDNLGKFIDKGIFKNALRKTGTAIGRSFAYTLLNMYSEENICPYETYTKFWAATDQKYGWGKISILKKNKNGSAEKLKIKNSFIARDNHNRCAFMEGYIKGVLDEGFRFTCYDLEKEGYEILPTPRVQVEKVKEIESKRNWCIFQVKYSNESYIESYVQLFKCYHMLKRKDYRDFYKNLRIPIEYATKTFLGLRPKSRIPTHKILSKMKNKNIEWLDFNSIESLYKICSTSVHENIEDSDKIYHDYQIVSNYISDLNETKLDDYLKEEVLRNVRK
ncbi:MAG: hypothetical protein JSV56_00460 [Methanomassiliicoccales archaeon]|nr:MAG: hypothetical protein JSV56_00460 [Methanomassiliicoccales archaeon]